MHQDVVFPRNSRVKLYTMFTTYLIHLFYGSHEARPPPSKYKLSGEDVIILLEGSDTHTDNFSAAS